MKYFIDIFDRRRNYAYPITSQKTHDAPIGLYPDRTFGRHCHHRNFGRHSVSRFCPRPRKRAPFELPVQLETNRIGHQQYSQDYDEKNPPYRNQLTGADTPFHALIQPYVKSAQLFKCPSNTGTNNGGNMQGTPNAAFNIPAIPLSYIANGHPGGGGDGGNRCGGDRPMDENNGRALAMMEFPATTILVIEARNKQHPDQYDANELGQVNNTFTNHLGNSNFLFVDGHVKALKPIATGSPLNMWNIRNATSTTATGTGPAPTDWANGLAAAQALMN